METLEPILEIVTTLRKQVEQSSEQMVNISSPNSGTDTEPTCQLQDQNGRALDAVHVVS